MVECTPSVRELETCLRSVLCDFLRLGKRRSKNKSFKIVKNQLSQLVTRASTFVSDALQLDILVEHPDFDRDEDMKIFSDVLRYEIVTQAEEMQRCILDVTEYVAKVRKKYLRFVGIRVVVDVLMLLYDYLYVVIKHYKSIVQPVLKLTSSKL
jgi:hypothetical protein